MDIGNACDADHVGSEFVIAFDAVEYAEEGVVVAVVLALEGFLDLGLALREALEAGLAEVDVIAFGVGIGAAAQADVPRLAESAAGPAAIAAEHVPALVLGHVDGLDVRAESFECDFVPLAEQKHGVLLVAELVSLLRGLLLDAGSASEVSALLPLEPVEGEVQREEHAEAKKQLELARDYEKTTPETKKDIEAILANLGGEGCFES